jgi:rubrerythrin
MLEEPTLRKSIELAIQTEKIGAKYYQELTEKFENDQEIREVFAQLAKDEKVHEQQFSELLKTMPDDEKIDPKQQAYLKAASISEFFKNDTFKDIAKIESPEEVMRRAFNFEKSTLFFYSALSEIIGESEQLNEIIKAEKLHVTNLLKVILEDAKFRGLQDTF